MNMKKEYRAEMRELDRMSRRVHREHQRGIKERERRFGDLAKESERAAKQLQAALRPINRRRMILEGRLS
ncbi:MAG: hypothetical protein ABSG04_14125 [Verrucomicrobiota bacterium]|jgi:hypothetical protein